MAHSGSCSRRHSSMARDTLDARIEVAEDRLTGEFGDRLSEDVILACVRTTCDSIAKDARITDYQPLLTEKVARDRLRDLAAAKTGR